MDWTTGINQSQFQTATSTPSSRIGMPIQASSLVERRGIMRAQRKPWSCGCHHLRHTGVLAEASTITLFPLSFNLRRIQEIAVRCSVAADALAVALHGVV